MSRSLRTPGIKSAHIIMKICLKFVMCNFLGVYAKKFEIFLAESNIFFFYFMFTPQLQTIISLGQNYIVQHHSTQFISNVTNCVIHISLIILMQNYLIQLVNLPDWLKKDMQSFVVLTSLLHRSFSVAARESKVGTQLHH